MYLGNASIRRHCKRQACASVHIRKVDIAISFLPGPDTRQHHLFILLFSSTTPYISASLVPFPVVSSFFFQIYCFPLLALLLPFHLLGIAYLCPSLFVHAIPNLACFILTTANHTKWWSSPDPRINTNIFGVCVKMCCVQLTKCTLQLYIFCLKGSPEA